MLTAGGIDHSIQDMALVLSITFMVPLIGAIAGAIVADIAVLHTGRKETGQEND